MTRDDGMHHEVTSRNRYQQPLNMGKTNARSRLSDPIYSALTRAAGTLSKSFRWLLLTQYEQPTVRSGESLAPTG